MKDNEATVSTKAVSRRTVVQAAAWSLPVIAAAATIPMAAASVNCVATVSSATASYAKLSATSAVFTWTNIFGDGKDLTLTLVSVPNGATNMTINQTNNFVLDPAMQGGEAQPSVRLSMDTVDLRNIAGGQRVTFSFAFDGAPTTVDALSYTIKDIDGVQALDGLGGAERVYLSEGTGTYNSDWIRGQGTGANPWRPFTGAPNSEVIPSSGAGNVAVSLPQASAFSLTFVANNSGRSINDRPNQNIWVGPFSFTAVNPACVL